MKYVTADTHFNHKNILKFRNGYGSTVEEHNETVLDKINSSCTKKDHLYILGDVIFGDDYSILERINPLVTVIPGNHDNIERLYNCGHIHKIRPYLKYEDVWLSHIPVHRYEIDSGRVIGNIHGHLHNNNVPEPEYICASIDNQDIVFVLNNLVSILRGYHESNQEVKTRTSTLKDNTVI